MTRIGRDGFWVGLQGRALYLDHVSFPWFRGASAAEIARVEMPHPGHLRWPLLDIDLSVDSIQQPERYPRVARTDRVSGS